MPAITTRYATITDGSLEGADGDGDGAYDLLDVSGTPDEMGARIGAYLATAGLDCGSDGDLPSDTEPVFLTLRIRIDAVAPLATRITRALAAAGLPVRPCGLNADWCVSAWHLGPSTTPNRTDGDYYLLDDEDGDAVTLARQYPHVEDEGGDSADSVVVLVASVTLDEAVTAAVAALRGAP